MVTTIGVSPARSLAAKAAEFALRGAALEGQIAVYDIAAPGEVAHHSRAQDPGVGRTDGNQPHAVDLARLRKGAGLQK